MLGAIAILVIASGPPPAKLRVPECNCRRRPVFLCFTSRSSSAFALVALFGAPHAFPSLDKRLPALSDMGANGAGGDAVNRQRQCRPSLGINKKRLIRNRTAAFLYPDETAASLGDNLAQLLIAPHLPPACFWHCLLPPHRGTTPYAAAETPVFGEWALEDQAPLVPWATRSIPPGREAGTPVPPVFQQPATRPVCGFGGMVAEGHATMPYNSVVW